MGLAWRGGEEVRLNWMIDRIKTIGMATPRVAAADVASNALGLFVEELDRRDFFRFLPMDRVRADEIVAAARESVLIEVSGGGSAVIG